MSDCIICAEKLNRTTRSVIRCYSCDFECCRQCYIRYISDREHLMECMNCKHEAEWEEIQPQIPKTPYLALRKKVFSIYVTEREKQYMDQTQSEIEMKDLKNTVEQAKKQFLEAETKAERKQAVMDQFEAARRIFEIKNQKVVSSASCINPDCNGTQSKYQSGKGYCSLCKWTSCHLCEERVVEGHECDKEMVATLTTIRSSAKPCPICKVLITRTEGCAQMFCTNCLTLFDWNTMKIERGWRHNPNYLEWLKQNPEEANKVNSNISLTDESKAQVEILNAHEFMLGIHRFKHGIIHFGPLLNEVLKKEDHIAFLRCFAILYTIEASLDKMLKVYDPANIEYKYETSYKSRERYLRNSINVDQHFKNATNQYARIEKNKAFVDAFIKLYEHVNVVNLELDQLEVSKEGFEAFCETVDYTQNLFQVGLASLNKANVILGYKPPTSISEYNPPREVNRPDYYLSFDTFNTPHTFVTLNQNGVHWSIGLYNTINI